MNMENRVKSLINKFPLLLPTVKKLNENNIVWMIAGSGCLYVNGNERVPEDIDFYLPAKEHERANQVFEIESFTYTSKLEKVKNSNPEGDHSMQLTSELRITKDGAIYDLEPSALVLESKTCLKVEGESFCFAPVEEALLVKAILGRGADMGKQDIGDIKNFIKIHPDIDPQYITKRQSELGLPVNFFSGMLD